MKLNIYKIISILILISSLLCVATTVYADNISDIVIEGFCLEKIVAGKRVFSIEADKASLGNKQVGFFNVGILKVVYFNNVNLEFYDGNGSVIKRQHLQKVIYDLNFNRLVDEHGTVIIDNLKF